MLIPAQCEKAVTIPERTGRPRQWRVVPSGWKTPLYAVLSATGNPFPAISESTCSFPQLAFYPVFSGLKAKEASTLKRLACSTHHPSSGNQDVKRSGRFGP